MSDKERGATLVEYALGIALVLVVSIPGIALVRDASSDELEDSAGRTGTPSEPIGVIGAPGGGTGSTSGSPDDGSTDSEPPPASNFTVNLSSGTRTQRTGTGQNQVTTWLAELTVAVRLDGQLVSGAAVSGVTSAGGSPTCTTSGNGNNVSCTLSAGPLDCAVASVDVSVSQVANQGAQTTFDPPQGLTISVPNGCN